VSEIREHLRIGRGDQVSEILLETKHLSFSYPGQADKYLPALDDINLQVRKGEYVALIGPNGSGKSTLLRQFNALLQPCSGEVIVDGMSTSNEAHIPRIRALCGMIFQNPDNQIIGATVEEDVAFGLENNAVPPLEIRHRVIEALKLMGISHLAESPPHLLSGGEKQKVALAGLLASSPTCLLLDEPSAMLDPAGQAIVMETICMLNKKQGLTVILVTHFPEEAALAGRVMILDKGRLVEEGPPSKVLTHLSRLHVLGLRSTTAGELAYMLREEGFPLSADLLHNEELVDQLCTYAQRI
jgi:energy-coupling factor transport system ATP-binding protein